MDYKMCIIIKLLIPPLITYPLPFGFLYQKLQTCYPLFLKFKTVYLLERFRPLAKNFFISPPVDSPPKAPPTIK